MPFLIAFFPFLISSLSFLIIYPVTLRAPKCNTIEITFLLEVFFYRLLTSCLPSTKKLFSERAPVTTEGHSSIPGVFMYCVFLHVLKQPLRICQELICMRRSRVRKKNLFGVYFAAWQHEIYLIFFIFPTLLQWSNYEH